MLVVAAVVDVVVAVIVSCWDCAAAVRVLCVCAIAVGLGVLFNGFCAPCGVMLCMSVVA